MKKTKKKAGGGMVGGALGALMSGDIRGAIPGVLGVMADKKIKRDRDTKELISNMAAKSSAARTPNAKKLKSGGKIRGDGCCIKGKTKGAMR